MIASRRPLLIDTDPGVDDALAVLMCLHDPRVHVVGLSVCGGNVGLNHTMRNALRLADHAQTNYQQTVPVFQGADRAILEPAVDAAFVHGSDGFGDALKASPQAIADPLPAARAIVELSHQYDGALEILALAPLTNIATALLLDPSLPTRVHRLTVMGGALNLRGNINAYAEFNFAVDPEAAAIVLQRFPALTLVDWSQTQALAPSLLDTLSWFNGASINAQFMRTISRKTETFKRGENEPSGNTRWEWADPLAAYVALTQSQPALTQYVEVLLSGPARGASVQNARRSPCLGVADVAASGFWQSIAKTLGHPVQ